MAAAARSCCCCASSRIHGIHVVQLPSPSSRASAGWLRRRTGAAAASHSSAPQRDSGGPSSSLTSSPTTSSPSYRGVTAAESLIRRASSTTIATHHNKHVSSNTTSNGRRNKSPLRLAVYQVAIKGRHRAGSKVGCSGCGVQVHFVAVPPPIDPQQQQQQQPYERSFASTTTPLSQNNQNNTLFYANLQDESTIHYSNNISYNRKSRHSSLDYYVDASKTAFLCDRCLALQQQEKQQYTTTDSEAATATTLDLETTDTNDLHDTDTAHDHDSHNIWYTHNVMEDLDPRIFAQQLQHRFQNCTPHPALCLMVVDSTDPEHSAIKKLRQIVQWQPVWLVFNKMDLLPRLSKHDQYRLVNRIRAICGGCVFEQSFAVSSKTGHGIHLLAETLLRQLGGRDVYVLGTANVGKSTLVQQLTNRIANAVLPKHRKDRHRRRFQQQPENHDNDDDGGEQDDVPITTRSHLPGTTLQSIRIACFASPHHALWDTPGIWQTKAVFSLFPSRFMEPLMRPRAIPVPDHPSRHGHLAKHTSLLVEAAWMNPKNNENDDNGDDGYCCLARVDIIDIEQGSQILAQTYLHPSLRVRVVPTHEAPDHATIPARWVHHCSGSSSSVTAIRTPEEPSSLWQRPLQAHTNTRDNPLGHVIPSDKACRNHKYYLDVVWANLGWISFTHHSKFALKPYCVQGSVYSHRPALYPVNLYQQLTINGTGIRDDDYDDDDDAKHWTVEEQRDILRTAAEEGRHWARQQQSNSLRAGKRRQSGGGVNDDDDDGKHWSEDDFY